jgi:hypothetical protein
MPQKSVAVSLIAAVPSQHHRLIVRGSLCATDPLPSRLSPDNNDLLGTVRVAARPADEAVSDVA